MASGGRPFQASASVRQARIHVKERFDRTLGATVVGRHTGEMINEITLAMVGGIGLRALSHFNSRAGAPWEVRATADGNHVSPNPI